MSNRSALLLQLTHLLGDEHVLTSAEELAPYVVDWRRRYSGRALAVVRPGDTASVAEVVRLCRAQQTPIVPQGGNTGLVGGATPRTDGEVVLSLSRVNRIRKLDPDAATLTVEAGATLQSVQEAAERQGFLFPLSLASEGSCQIGGNLSTNAGGTQVLRYGTMRDLVLGLEVVLPDGQIWHGLRELRKDNTGYDLKQLFLGAEGTLGIITAAVLKLFARPKVRITVLLACASVESLLTVFSRLRAQLAERITGFEVFSQRCTELVEKHFSVRNPLSGYAWYALAQIDDTLSDSLLGERLQETLGSIIEDGDAQDAVVAQSLTQARSLWGLRENISEAQRLEGYSVKHDIALPLQRIPEFVNRAHIMLAQASRGLDIVAFGHMGDGNLHYNLWSDSDEAALKQRSPELSRLVHDLVHELGGSISAEHGLGQLKREEIKRYKSAVELDLMRRIKQAIDPDGLMNPGKLI